MRHRARAFRIITTVIVAGWLGCAKQADDEGGGETGVGPGEVGFCWKTCESAEDCCDLFTGAAYMQCKNGELPSFGFVCNAGTCEFGGCTSDEECQSLSMNSSYVCSEIDGRGLCLEPCASASDCTKPDDVCEPLPNGVMYCTAPPCESDADCPGDQFRCTDGECIFVDCEVDADCENGGSCQDNSCRCELTSECNDSLECIPVPS